MASQSLRDAGRGSRCGAPSLSGRRTLATGKTQDGAAAAESARNWAFFPPKGRLGSGEGLAARPGMAELGSGSFPLLAV